MRLFFSLCTCILCCACLRAQALSPEQASSIDSTFLADIPAGGPGGAIGIIRDGKVIYTRFAGLADLDTKRAIDAKTRFNIASNGKQYTALATLQLIHEGKLRLEEDIRTYLPGLYPDITEPITVAHLINHTSGIRDVYHLWNFQGITWWEQSFSNADALKLLEQQQELNFPPGSRYLYSNSNYLLLTQIIATITGRTFRAYTDELFHRLGMVGTNFVNDHRDTGPNVARPYFNFDTWTTFDWLTDLHGDGALFSSLEDQLAWEVALQRGEAAGLSAELLAGSQQPVNAAAHYGFGLEHGEYRGVPIRWHDGSTGAWDASVIRFPDQHLTILAADNSGKFGTSTLVRAVADIVLGEVFTEEAFLTAPRVIGTEIPVEKLLGTYLGDSGFAFTLKLVDGKLILERAGRSDNELELEGGNIYHQKFDPDFKQEFTYDEALGMQVTAYYWSHPPYTLTRADVDWEGYEFTGAEGNFHSDELSVCYKLTHVEGQNYTIAANGGEMKGTMYKPDRILVNGGKNIRLVRDAGGKVIELLVSDDRTRDLRFLRK